MNAVICKLSTGQEVVLDADHWFLDWPETAQRLPAAPHDAIWAWASPPEVFSPETCAVEAWNPIVITRGYIVTSRLAAITRPVHMGTLTFTKEPKAS